MKHIAVIFLIFSLPLRVFAAPLFSSLLPNPAWDDTLGEYIEIRNTGCADIDIAGYELRDIQRWYIFPSPSIIPSKSNLHLKYQASHIALNNSWLETITLSNTEKSIVDTYSYSGTQYDNVVLSISLIDEDCTPSVENTGSIDSWTWVIEIPINTGSTSTWEINNSGFIFTGTISDSGSIYTWSFIDTGSIFPSSGSSGSTSSWAILSDTWVVEYIESGALIPMEMYYSDNDNNNKIDTLEILYPFTLTWSIHTENIFLFSESWWLWNRKIDTESWYILSWSLSWNILILSLREGDKEKITLRINNTTSSDLRLKSSWDLGLRSIGGQTPEWFFLTKSFDEYRKVYKKIVNNWDLIVDDLGIWTNSGIASGTGNSSSTGNISETDSSTWVLSWSTNTRIIFPEILPTIQSPTNAIFSWEIFICTTSDCRINITLESFFSSGFSMKDFTCLFGTGEILLSDSDCNPNTVYYHNSGSLIIEIASKSDPTQKIQKSYSVEWKIVSVWWAVVIVQNTWIPDTGKPIAIMELDSKWKEYYYQNGDNNLFCYTFTCSVNFTAENSYDPEWSTLRFLWIYGPNDISTSKDPGGRKYSFGDHSISLRVIDMSGNYSQIDYRIHVVWPKPKEEKIKSTKSETKKKITIIPVKKRKKYKKIKMRFFTPPSVILQWKTWVKIHEWEYVCQAKTKNICTINFSLTWVEKGYESTWIIDEKEVYRGKNPKSWKFSVWIHEIKILTYRKWSTLASDETKLSVRVLAQVKMAKKKKVKKVLVKKSKKVVPKLIPEAHAEDENITNSSKVPSIWLLIFLSWIFIMGLILEFRKKYFFKMSK